MMLKWAPIFVQIFGKKGSGKTTFLACAAQIFSKQGRIVYCTEPNIQNTFFLPASQIGSYWLSEGSVLLIDELSVVFNSRDFKSLSVKARNWFKYSRHNKVMIFGFSQHFDDSDRQVRNMADVCYMAKNMGLFAYYRKVIPFMDLMRDPQGKQDILEGYEKAPLLSKGAFMFVSLRRWRKYFNSYSRLDVPDIDNSSLTKY